MGWIALIAVLIIVLAVVAAALGAPEKGNGDYPYRKNQFLFSPAERSFLGVLEQAVGEDYRVLGKVRVADVVSVKPLTNRSAWQRAFNRISGKHFDFILCSKDDLEIIAAIELDDKSHQRRKRRERDSFLVNVCRAASLSLIQVPAQRAYSVEALRAQILSSLGVEQEAAVKPQLPPVATRDAKPVQVEREDLPAEPLKPVQNHGLPDAPACPNCSAFMVKRQAKSGPNAGKVFWGCSAFPKCRTIMPVSA